jgi:hypothetical protein
VPLRHLTSPQDAQRTVTQFVILEIGDRLYGGSPSETQDDEGRNCWLVPVILALPDNERHQRVGKILVDATTGRIQMTDNLLSSLSTKAERLASQPVPAKRQTANQTT